MGEVQAGEQQMDPDSLILRAGSRLPLHWLSQGPSVFTGPAAVRGSERAKAICRMDQRPDVHL